MVSVIFSGIMMSLRLKKRCVFLSEILLLISQLGLEIEFINLPVLEILKKIESGECCRNLDFITVCIDNVSMGEDFFYSWKKGVEASCLPMKKEEREKLESLGSMLGTSDSSGQRAILSLYESYFSAFYDKARLAEEKYAKMYVTLSVVTGVGVFILTV